jgi:hypothetical protein
LQVPKALEVEKSRHFGGFFHVRLAFSGIYTNTWRNSRGHLALGMTRVGKIDAHIS